MPVCPQCDNRPFSNKEALLQHMKSSSAWHPFCAMCDRRFSSQMAYDAHMTDKHPPTFDCVICNRSYHALFALEDHYRGSVAHPNCVRCGRGFRDSASCEEHQRTEHEGPISELDHPPNAVTPTEVPNAPDSDSMRTKEMTSTPSSPRNHVQALIIQEEQSVLSPRDLLISLPYSSPLTEVKPLFSPVSPSPLPRPADEIERFWTSRQNITTSRRPLSIAQPDWFTSTDSAFSLRNGRSTLFPPRVSPPHINVLPSPPNSAHKVDFDSRSRLYPGMVRQALRLQSDALERRQVLGDGVRSWGDSVRASEDQPRPISRGSRASIFYETLTPRGDMSEASPQSLCDNLGNSSSSHSNEPDTRPTTAASTPCIQPITYTVIPSSELPSPRSPDVVSPIGLGALPTISPFPSTPIDLLQDIPEANKPLPESPVGSPNTVFSRSFEPSDEIEPSSSLSNAIPARAQTPPSTSVALIATPSTSSTSNPNPLHCRVCLADSCDDITASMCGHIFCNRCITNAVIKTNRCPVCMTPTLLYCLFRLDLAA